MDKFATFFDDALNSDNPQHARIIRQREIYEAWTEQTSSFRPSFEHFQEELKAILPVSIYEMYGVNRADLAMPIISDPLLQKIQDSLIGGYDKRGLHFPLKDLHAIANPDEPEENPERVRYQGCFNLMGDTCYQMDVPILLTKRQDEDAFDFFFVLKLAKLPLVEIDSFLEYHQTANFAGDTDSFCRYLSVLKDGLHEIAGFDAVQVSKSQSKIIEEWCSLQLSQRAASSSNLDKEDWGKLTPIFPEMKEETFRKLIAYLGRYESARKGNEILPILLESDIELLQRAGFSLPSNPPIKIKPNLGKGDKALLYFFFYFIWKRNNTTLKDSKDQIALFINTWFQLDVPVTPDALRKHTIEANFENGLKDIWSKR